MEDVRPRLCLSELLAGVEDGMMSLPTRWRLTPLSGTGMGLPEPAH